MTDNVWQAGDFARIAPGAQIVGEVLCDAIPVYAGERVIDIGCGTGNTALAAARRRAIVAGVDPVEKLLDRARERAKFEGLEIDFQLAPAEALPYPDAAFDVALSTFGLIFSDKPEDSIREAARVLRPGGRLGFTSWSAASMNYRLFEICQQARPEMVSIGVAQHWGHESYAVEQLSRHFASIEIEKRIFYPRAFGVEQWLAGMKLFLAPVYLAYENASAELAAQLDREFLALGHKHNRNPEHGFFAEIEYLEIRCRKT